MSNTQSKNKALVFIIILLLLSNIALVGYLLFFCKKPNQNKNKGGFATVLQKEVGFNQQQVEAFNKLKGGNWSKAKEKMSEILTVKNAIFDFSKQETPDSVVQKLADSIGRLQAQVEMSAYKHVKEVRKICTPAQLPAYDSLMKKIINRGPK